MFYKPRTRTRRNGRKEAGTNLRGMCLRSRAQWGRSEAGVQDISVKLDHQRHRVRRVETGFYPTDTYFKDWETEPKRDGNSLQILFRLTAFLLWEVFCLSTKQRGGIIGMTVPNHDFQISDMVKELIKCTTIGCIGGFFFPCARIKPRALDKLGKH